MNMDAAMIDRLQGMSMRMMSPGGKPTASQAKAMAQLGEQGRIETVGCMSMANGMRGMNVMKVADPAKYIAASQALMEAMKGDGGPSSFYKDLKIDLNAGTHQGITFRHIVATLDFEKMAQAQSQQPVRNCGHEVNVRRRDDEQLAGHGRETRFPGHGPDLERRQGSGRYVLEGECRHRLTCRLQERALAVARAGRLSHAGKPPGLVRMIATQLAATLNKPDLKAPADLPSEPVLFGGSLTPRPPASYEFHLVVPSQVGPIFEKGIVPLFQSITPPGNP